MPLEYISRIRDHLKLCSSGCLYIKDKCNENGIIFWICDESKKFRCPALVHTTNEQIVKRIGEHNHAGDAAGIQAKKTVEEMKRAAATTQESTHRVVGH